MLVFVAIKHGQTGNSEASGTSTAWADVRQGVTESDGG